MKKYRTIFQKCGRGSYVRFKVLAVGVARKITHFSKVWQHGTTNLRCACDRRTWLDRLGYWSWLRIYILYIVGNASMRTCSLYFSKNLLYPFTLRVTGIKRTEVMYSISQYSFRSGRPRSHFVIQFNFHDFLIFSNHLNS